MVPGQDQGVTPKSEDAEMAEKPAQKAGKKQDVAELQPRVEKSRTKGKPAAPRARVRTGVPGTTVRR
jgi:hypothetical protein